MISFPSDRELVAYFPHPKSKVTEADNLQTRPRDRSAPSPPGVTAQRRDVGLKKAEIGKRATRVMSED
jgi:hypothetical protein